MLYYFVILQFMVKKNIQMHFNTEKILLFVLKHTKQAKKSKFIFFLSFPDSEPKSTLPLKEIHHVSAKLFEPCLLWSVTQ